MDVLAPKITPRAALSSNSVYIITQSITHPTIQTYTTTLSLRKPQATQTSQSHLQLSKLSPSSIGAIVGSILGVLVILLLLYCCCIRQSNDVDTSYNESSHLRNWNTLRKTVYFGLKTTPEADLFSPEPQQEPELASLPRTPTWFGKPIERSEGNLRIKKKKKKHRPPQFEPQQ